MFDLYVQTWDNEFVERVTKKNKGGIIMITTTTEKMLKNKDLRNGVINYVIWNSGRKFHW